MRALHRAGIAQTGMPGEITIMHVKDFRIAFLGFAPYPNTGSLTDLPAARRLIHRASEKADLVVVAIHAGAEGTAALHLTGGEETYLGEDRGNPEAFAHMAVDAGADLVLGSGPHVLRAMELYHDRLIAYSLGNFAGYHNFTVEGVLGESVVLHVTLAADGAFRAGPARVGEARRRRPAGAGSVRRRRPRSSPSSRARTSARAAFGWGRAASFSAAGRRPHFQGLAALPPFGAFLRTASVAITRLTLLSAPRRASAPAVALPPSAVVDVAQPLEHEQERLPT